MHTYQNVGKIVGGATVCIGGLNNANLDRIDIGILNKFHDEHGSKTSNLVTIQQLENTIYTNIR